MPLPRQVDDAAFGERPAVGHSHLHFLAVGGVPHPQYRAERVCQVGAGHAVAVVKFPVAHFPSVQFVRIIARFAGGLFLGGQQACAYGQADAAADDSCRYHGYACWAAVCLCQRTAGGISRKIGIFLSNCQENRLFLFLLRLFACSRGVVCQVAGAAGFRGCQPAFGLNNVIKPEKTGFFRGNFAGWFVIPLGESQRD